MQNVLPLSEDKSNVRLVKIKLRNMLQFEDFCGMFR